MNDGFLFLCNVMALVTLNHKYEQLFDVGTLFFTIKIFNLTKNKTAHAKGRQNVSGRR